MYYTYDYDRDGDVDTDDAMIADSCYRAKMQWEKFEIGDTFKIVIDGVKCTDEKNNTITTYVVDTRTNTREEEIILRIPGPCHPNEIVNTYESCIPVYVEADVSDGFIRSRVTEEAGRLEWVDLQHLNHEELKTHPTSIDQLERLFKGSFPYTDQNKYGFFKLRNK